MARKTFISPKYYAYYDKRTGALLSVTNEKSTTHKHYVEIPFEMHDNLVSGKEKFDDYIVGNLTTDDGKTILSLVPKLGEAYSFKNTMLEIVDTPPTDTTEFVIEWNSFKKYWSFSLSGSAKQRIGDSLSDSRIPVFIILESDYDFLIRTIIINCRDLIKKSKLSFPFEDDIEARIDKITLATKLTFQSHGLKIND
jgi:hypothetical protein